MAKNAFAKDSRVLAKVDKNQWHVGTITKITKKGISVRFDDGFAALVEPDDFKHLHVLAGSTKRIKKVLTDVEAKQLLVPAKKSPKKLSSALVFEPPELTVPYKTAFSLLKKWLARVAEHYKISNTVVDHVFDLGTVGAARTFSEEGPTKAKYARMVEELAAAFIASGKWRVQIFAGHYQLFSHNGRFQATFYDIAHPTKDDARKIGFYIRCNTN